MEKIFDSRWKVIGLYLFFSALIICIRASLSPFISNDLTIYFFPWFDSLKSQGLAQSLRSGFSAYSPPYLYLLYFTTFLEPWIGKAAAIKLIPNIFDFASAYLVSRILLGSGKSQFTALFGFVTYLIFPTIIFNGALWGQCDTIFGFGMLLFLYGILQKRSTYACIGFAVGFAFKFQMFFFSPVLLYAFMEKRIQWKSLLFIPGIWIASVIPALLMKAPIKSVLGRLENQLQHFPALTMNAPNIYQWIPAKYYSTFVWPGVLFAFLITLLVVMAFYWKNRKRESAFQEFVAFSYLVTLLVPLVSPRVHDRYFYLSDVASVLYLFYFPNRIALVLTTQIVAFLTYQPFLFMTEVVPLKFLPLAYLAVAAVLVKQHLVEEKA